MGGGVGRGPAMYVSIHCQLIARFERDPVGYGILGQGQFLIQLTPSSSRPSRRCRGMMVTVSISARKAISGGVMPRGRGKAIEVSRAEYRQCLFAGRTIFTCSFKGSD